MSTVRDQIAEAIDDETLTRTGRSLGILASCHVAGAAVILAEIEQVLADYDEAIVDEIYARLAVLRQGGEEVDAS